jgi:hypothetical protein
VKELNTPATEQQGRLGLTDRNEPHPGRNPVDDRVGNGADLETQVIGPITATVEQRGGGRVRPQRPDELHAMVPRPPKHHEGRTLPRVVDHG